MFLPYQYFKGVTRYRGKVFLQVSLGISGSLNETQSNKVNKLLVELDSSEHKGRILEEIKKIVGSKISPKVSIKRTSYPKTHEKENK